MAAAIAPIRFLLENEGRPMEDCWSHTLRLVLGFDVDEQPVDQAESELPSLEDELGVPLPGKGILLMPDPEAVPEPLSIKRIVGSASGTPEELSFLKVSLEAWLSAKAVSVVSTPTLPCREQLPEVVLLSSSMSNWLKGGTPR
ncbi:hypothetical protein [Hyalangium versicolor]|uniref:hypothetical protein n=1 Tax=Hyalangium versicolor TaxID=2861190 RepID=UPI001CCE3B9E|nr:hypothetical protein [Hyalangium versicolor]